MTSLKNLLFDDNMTRVVENPDTHNAFYESNNFLSIRHRSEAQGIYYPNKDKNYISDRKLFYVCNEYRDYINAALSDSDSIINKTIISPQQYAQVSSKYHNHFGRHKHSSSGRNFCKSTSENTDFGMRSFIVKGGDLIKKNKFRFVPHSYALPFFGAATEKELEHEFSMAQYIQNTALSILGRPTYMPQPIKVSLLEQYYHPEDKKEYNYKHIITELIHRSQANILNIATIDVENDFGNFYYNSEKRSYTTTGQSTSWNECLEPYREKLGEHGSYLYMIEGTNMRLSDVLSLSSKNSMKRIIGQHYPKQWTDEQIIEAFMTRFAEVHGMMFGLGVRYKPDLISQCFPVDTTIQGLKMDIGTYSLQGNVFTSDTMKQQLAYIETCFLFYSIFNKPSIGEFTELFDKHFYKTFCTTIAQTINSIDFSKVRNPNEIYDGWKKLILPGIVKGLKHAQKDPKNWIADMKYIEDYLKIIND